MDMTTDEDGQVDNDKFEQALALIILPVGEDQMVYVEECQSAREVSQKLKSMHTAPKSYQLN